VLCYVVCSPPPNTAPASQRCNETAAQRRRQAGRAAPSRLTACSSSTSSTSSGGDQPAHGARTRRRDKEHGRWCRRGRLARRAQEAPPLSRPHQGLGAWPKRRASLRIARPSCCTFVPRTLQLAPHTSPALLCPPVPPHARNLRLPSDPRRCGTTRPRTSDQQPATSLQPPASPQTRAPATSDRPPPCSPPPTRPVPAAGLLVPCASEPA
jgi:hypothetical protein